MHTQTYLGDNFISITLYPAVVVPNSWFIAMQD